MPDALRKIQDAFTVISENQDQLGAEDHKALENLYRQRLGGWEPKFKKILHENLDEATANRVEERFANAFSVSFQEAHTPLSALEDIAAIERLLSTNASVVISFSKQESSQQDSIYHLSMYHQGASLTPSRMLRIVENLGFTPVSDQHFTCNLTDGGAVRTIHIHDFPVQISAEQWQKVLARAVVFEELVQVIWENREGNDRLNELLIFAELNMREIKLLRAVGRYLMQARLPYSQEYYAEILVRHAPVARLMVDYFHARFNPDARNDSIADAICTKVLAYISEVKSLDEDRVLRRVLNVLQSMLRTNFYQRTEMSGYKPQLSFKILSGNILDLPKPAPLYETFVYSHRVEAIHLRSSKISRGGIRWSDRREDFRDEVLDLMKAQTVKNSVIVPSGAKGGFYVKRPPLGGDRKAVQEEAIACYQMFIRGLLDITDNWVQGTVIKPQNVVCYDEDDPYLVVAADKGTASFSDIANALSAEYNFWLGDAFASGGSAGYDHKKMGITARGAWESVRQHGYNLNMNVDQDPITVIGVGDMGGDVFGNGLLCSPYLRLIGAFSYSHIFCDPSPDSAISFAERQRLFEAAGNWDQYNTALLSAGGRIYSRADKELELTPEIQAAFGLTKNKVTPAELMQAILRAQVDLLWFGGIGTYVKAASEQDSDARDKANDFIRINANELRTKIVAEGANLGMTQRSRVEAARAGIALNTDFIDNSAGVNTSDYEVNIKILLNQVMLAGDLTEPQRNAFLASMTNSIADHVLVNNKLQNACLSVSTFMSPTRTEHFARLIEDLEQSNHLDRKREALPTEQELNRLGAEKLGLTRPEMSIVLSHTKLMLTHVLAQDLLVNDEILTPLLHSYFPQEMVERYAAAIKAFPLRSQLVAMLLSNRIVNQTSPYLPKWLKDRTGLGYVEIARAFCICSELYHFNELWQAAYETPGLAAPVWQDLLLELLQHMDRTLPWLLNQTELLRDMSSTVARYRPHFDMLAANILELLPSQRRYYRDEHEKRLIAQNIPPAMAAVHANLRSLAAAPGIIALALDINRDVLEVARIYFRIGERFGFDSLREQARQSMGIEYWERQAISALIEDFSSHQLRMTQLVLQQSGGDLLKWEEYDPQLVGRLDSLISELRQRQSANVTQLTVANRRLRGLVPGGR